MYLRIKRRSYIYLDFIDTTGSWGGSPEIAQKNMVLRRGSSVGLSMFAPKAQQVRPFPQP